MVVVVVVVVTVVAVRGVIEVRAGFGEGNLPRPGLQEDGEDGEDDARAWRSWTGLLWPGSGASL